MPVLSSPEQDQISAGLRRRNVQLERAAGRRVPLRHADPERNLVDNLIIGAFSKSRGAGSAVAGVGYSIWANYSIVPGAFELQEHEDLVDGGGTDSLPLRKLIKERNCSSSFGSSARSLAFIVASVLSLF